MNKGDFQDNFLLAGNLRNVNGIYHVCLNWYEDGKRKTKSFTTKIHIKEPKAKKRANALLLKYRQTYKPNIKQIRYSYDNDKIINDEEETFLFDVIDKVYNIKFQLEDLKPTTIENIKNYIILFKRNIRNIKIKDLNTEFIEESLLPFAKRSIFLKYRSIFRTVIQFLMKKNIISKDPLYFCFKTKIRHNPRKALNAKNYSLFLSKIKYSKHYLEYLILISLGLRISELLGLKFSDIDFKKKEIKISRNVVKIKKQNIIQSTLKSKKSERVLPLSNKLIEEILKRKALNKKNKKEAKSYYIEEYSDFICLNKIGNLKTRELLYNDLKSFLENNNLEKISLHELRHTAATKLYLEDIDLKTIQYFLGHSNILTTANIYTHFNKEQIKKIEKVLENIDETI